MVVSEMKERLSPNIAPPITVATQRARFSPEAALMAAAIGTISVMVPQEVPIDRDTKQLMIKIAGTANYAGIRERIK